MAVPQSPGPASATDARQRRSCDSACHRTPGLPQPVHSARVAIVPPCCPSMAGRWLSTALVALAIVAVALPLHGADASPNATIANGSANGKPFSERHNYNASSADLITPDEINAGLLEYVAGPLPLAAVEAAKPKRANARPAAIYMNEFAVYIPRGGDVADSIAHKYGFSNMGQLTVCPVLW
uniref:Peptidase S8 pro-domain domain-containing protein n=1 Tax=Anopheles epiroticus TaxID=199890 RepID=A0A182PQ12_9DIPT